MGILEGMLSGVGEAGLQLASDQRKQWAAEDLQERGAQIQSQRDISLLKLKATMDEQARTNKVGRLQGAANGIIGQQFDSAAAAYNKPGLQVDGRDMTEDERSAALAAISSNRKDMMASASRDPKLMRDSAIAAGYMEDATALSNIIKADDNTERNYRHDALIDAKNQQLAAYRERDLDSKARERESRINRNDRAGQPKEVDKAKINKEFQGLSANYLKNAPAHPFRNQDDPGGKNPDAAKANLIMQKGSELVIRARQMGDNDIDPGKAFVEVQQAANQYDKIVQAQVRKNALNYYDKKGNPKDGTIAELQTKGFSEQEAMNSESYMRASRDAMMGVPQFTDYLESSRNAPAEKPADKPADSKPSGIFNVAATDTKPKAAPPATPVAPKAPEDGINIGNDTVLNALTRQLAGIDKSDPASTQTIMAIGKARNTRLAQLQDKYGSQTKLTGY